MCVGRSARISPYLMAIMVLVVSPEFRSHPGCRDAAVVRTNRESYHSRVRLKHRLDTSSDTVASMIARRLIPRASLLAAFALICAQFLWASHEIEHLGNVDKDTCQVCLTGHAIGSPLSSSSSTLAFPPAPAAVERPPGYSPTAKSCYRAHRARAPPAPVRS